MKCCIVRDLLPNYIEGLTSEEANVEIRAHLEGCESCRRACALMSADLTPTAAETSRRIDLLKRFRRRLWERYAAIALLTAALFTGLLLFAKNYRTPLPYDPDCMTTEIYQAAPVVQRFGITQWTDVKSLTHTTSQTAEQDHQAAEQSLTSTISLVRLVAAKPAQWDGLSSCGRTIQRGEQTVRVVYHCYTRTLWDRLFPARLDRMTSTGDIYGQRLWTAEYTPIWTEIYYLPTDYRRMGQLSDAAFDALKEDAVLIWQGMN